MWIGDLWHTWRPVTTASQCASSSSWSTHCHSYSCLPLLSSPKLCRLSQRLFSALGTQRSLQGNWEGAERSVSLSQGHGSAAGQLEWCRSLLLPGPPPGQEEEEKTLRTQRWILNCVGGEWFSSCSCLIAELIGPVSWAACFDSVTGWRSCSAVHSVISVVCILLFFGTLIKI